MIIPENREKVKRKALSLLNKSDIKLSKPDQKFILEMILGMLLTGGSNLTEISRSLKEQISIKDTLKRLGRMLSHDHLLEAANKISLKECRNKVNSKTILALDTGDITHQYGKKFENISYVHDGSSNSLKQGYILNQITGFNPSTGETFPLSLDMYSAKEKGFVSANTESLTLVDNAIKVIGKEGLWVMDREYDNGIILEYFLSNSLDFMVRMKSSRNLIINGKKVNIKELANSINRRTKYSSYSRFGSKKAVLRINGTDHPVTLISLKDRRNREPIYWLTNGWIKSTVELKRRIRPKFIYYRLLKGVQNLFEGIRELFRFRLKRKEKNKIRRQLKKDKSLFPDFRWKMSGLEV